MRTIAVDVEEPRPIRSETNPRDNLLYVWIPPTEFRIGHEVTIPEGFWLGQTEVTEGAYKRFMDATGGPEKGDGNRTHDYPVRSLLSG